MNSKEVITEIAVIGILLFFLIEIMLDLRIA